MIDLENIQSGDVAFIYNKFDNKNIDTWISPIVRVCMNFQNWVLGKRLIRHQHCGIFVYDSYRTLYFCESVSSGWKVSLASAKFSSKKKEDVLIKRFPIDTFVEPLEILSFRSKYNYIGLLSQLVRQLSFNIIDLEAQKRGTKFLYCSQSCAYWLYRFSSGKLCQYWHSTDTQDLQFDLNGVEL